MFIKALKHFYKEYENCKKYLFLPQILEANVEAHRRREKY